MRRLSSLPPKLARRASAWLGDGTWHADSQEVFDRPWLGIAGSRLGRDLQLHPTALAMLRSVFGDARHDGRRVVWCTGTAVDELVSRAVELFQIDGARITIDEDASCPQAATTCIEKGGGRVINVVVSLSGVPPPLPYPRRDCAAVGLASALAVLHVRSGGVVERLVQHRLQENASLPEQVRIAATTAAARRLISQGAVGWYALPECTIEEAERSVDCDGRSLPAGVKKVDLEQELAPNYLIHCTRAANVATPSFRVRSKLDRLILGPNPPREDALANLIRILRSGWLRGGHQLTRGTSPVICFSAAPLKELIARREFRPHLGRWDYEPYGIAIKRDVMQARGARPVRYLDASEVNAISDTIFVHPRGTTYDWSAEREWRYCGDLRLETLSPEDAFVFVATADEVPGVQRWSPWPVIPCLTR